MKKNSLSLLGWLLLAGGLIAWFIEPTRRIDWIPIVVLSVVVLFIDARVKELEQRIDKLSSPRS